MAFLSTRPIDWDPATHGYIGDVDPDGAWYHYLVSLEERDNNSEGEREFPQSEQLRRTAQNVHQAGLQSRHWPTRHRYLTLNFLSQFWTWEAVREDPSRLGGLAIAYAFGIVGYALALPFRIAIFVKEIFLLPVSIFKNLYKESGTNFFQNLKVRLLCLFGATGELFSGTVGLVCPPLAYLIDEKIQDNLVINANSGVRGRHVDRGENIILGLINNEKRLVNKNILLRPIETHLKGAVDRMAEYINRDDLAACAPLTIKQTSLIALLLKWKANLAENQDVDFLDPLMAFLNHYHETNPINFGQHQEIYSKRWTELKENYRFEEIVDMLILRSIIETKGDDAISISEKEFKEGKFKEILGELETNLAHEDAFSHLYEALSGMTAAIIESDNELLTLFGQLSQLQDDSQLGDDSQSARGIAQLIAELNEWWVHLGIE